MGFPFCGGRTSAENGVSLSQRGLRCLKPDAVLITAQQQAGNYAREQDLRITSAVVPVRNLVR
jgi:hypothetical protein